MIRLHEDNCRTYKCAANAAWKSSHFDVMTIPKRSPDISAPDRGCFGALKRILREKCPRIRSVSTYREFVFATLASAEFKIASRKVIQGQKKALGEILARNGEIYA